MTNESKKLTTRKGKTAVGKTMYLMTRLRYLSFTEEEEINFVKNFIYLLTVTRMTALSLNKEYHQQHEEMG